MPQPIAHFEFEASQAIGTAINPAARTMAAREAEKTCLRQRII